MDFSLTGEQTSLVELAARILADRATPERLAELEGAGTWPDPELWAELARAGLVGLSLPAEHGGGDAAFLETCLVLEQLGRRVAPVPVWATVVLGALPIARFGDAAQRARDLPDVARGRAHLTAALAEPGGDDPTRPQTRAIADAGTWRLDGVKTAVPLHDGVRRIVVPAATGDDGVTVLLVEPGTPGVVVEQQEVISGEPHAVVRFDGVVVEGSEVLGEPGDGVRIVTWLVERALTGLAALQAGVCGEALAMTAAYAADRKQFDRPIASFQAVGQRLADAYIDVEGIRLPMLQAAWRLDADLDATTEVAVAKWWAADAGHRVIHTAQHVHGGVGVDTDYPLHRHFRAAKQIEFTLGAATEQLLRIGDALAGEPA